MHRPRGDMGGHRGGHHGPGPRGPFGRGGGRGYRPVPPPHGGFGRNYGPPPPHYGGFGGHFGGWRHRHNGCLGGCLLPLLAFGALIALTIALIF